MSCCDCIKCWRWKKKKVKKAKEEFYEPRLSIWNQMYLLTSMSYFLEEDKKETLQLREQSPFLFNRKAVRIFDISESAMRELEVDAFYSFYLSQAQFEKTPRSLVSPSRIYRYDFGEITKAFKTFSSFEHKDVGDRTDLEEFLTSFDFLPKYNRMTVFRFTNRPLTLYECAHLESNLLRNSIQDYDVLESEWLQLMSWWRLANRQLQTSVAETVTNIKTNETDFLFSKQAIKSVIHLGSLVSDLDLIHGSAELSALRLYIPLEKRIPDSNFFLPSYNFDFSTAKTGFFHSVSEDSRWISFATGCGYYSINACFVVLRLLFSKVEEDDAVDVVAEVFRPLVVEFYYDIILPLSMKVNLGSYVVHVVEKSMEHFIHVIQNLQNARNRNDVDRYPMDTTITLVTRMLYSLVDVIFEDKQVAEFFGDQTTFMMKISIYHFLLDLMKTAVFLVHKVFQRDFVTVKLLSTLSRHKPQTLGTTLSETSCAQLAYILISAYKIMHRTSSVPEDCIRLRSNFSWSDFVMFIDELRSASGLQELGTEVLSMEFAIRWQEIQHRLTKEVERNLSNITDIAQTANEILKEVKYIL